MHKLTAATADWMEAISDYMIESEMNVATNIPMIISLPVEDDRLEMKLELFQRMEEGVETTSISLIIIDDTAKSNN